MHVFNVYEQNCGILLLYYADTRLEGEVDPLNYKEVTYVMCHLLI